MARPYRPNQPTSWRALVAMICAGLGTALLLSVAWPSLGSLGRMLLVGSLAPALIIGLFLSWVAERMVFANSRAASAIAIIATATAIVGGHYQEYRGSRAEDLARAEEQRDDSLAAGQPYRDVARDYEANVANIAFANYLRAYFLDPTSDVGPALGVGVYVVEVLCALLASAYFPQGRASEPACSACHRWYRLAKPKRAAHGVSKTFVAALNSEQSDAMAILHAPDTVEYTSLSLGSCPASCGSPRVLRVVDETRTRSSDGLVSRHRADLLLTAAETKDLEAWG